MHDAPAFLTNLALVLGVAAVTTIVFQRMRMPVVFGYLLAGLVVGPHVPVPLVADVEIIRTLSELGVILLMFSLGLEFRLPRLFAAGWGVPMIAVLETSLVLWLGYLAGRVLGWTGLESLFAGAAIAISSTTIVVKTLGDGRARAPFVDLVFGILVFEDLIAILLLALLTPVAAGHAPSGFGVLETVVRLVGFLVALLGAGMLLVPRLVRFVVRLDQPETTLVASVGICFATALLAHTIGYSVALGAFLAGSLVAESGESPRISKLVAPLRDLFAAVFFVSVGMTLDPRVLVTHGGLVLLFVAVVLFGKIGAVTLSAFLTGTGIRTAVATGMSLAQIGEFSFILAGVGLAGGAASPLLTSLTIAVSTVTALTTPLLVRASGPVAATIDGRLPRSLQTFVALYGSWIENVRTRPETSSERAALNVTLRRLALDAVVVLGIAIGAAVGAPSVGARLATATALPPASAVAIVGVAAGLVALPFLGGIVGNGRRLGQQLGRRAFPDPEPGRLDRAAAPRRALVVTIQLATVLVVGAPLVALTQPFLPPAVSAVLVVVSLSALALAVWRTANDLQGHVRAAAEAIVDAIGRHSTAVREDEAEQALHRAYQLLPGLGEPVPVRLARDAAAIGATLGALELRGRTGATVVAISRGEEVVLVPDGHVVLREGDVVALAGTREAIAAARAALTTERPR